MWNLLYLRSGQVDWSRTASEEPRPRGSNTHDLINACRKNGLIAQARYGLAVDDLMLANAPMILHVKPPGGNGYYHWLLFLGFDEDGKAKIYDPPEGIGTLAKATVLAIWDGVAINIARQNEPLFALPFCPSTLVVAM